MNTTEISASRWKTLLYLGISLAFVVIALLGLRHPSRDAEKLQLALVFFGPCVAVFAWMLIRPSRLLLDDEGFMVLGGFTRSRKKIYWRDIDKFFIYRLPRGIKAIGYNYKPSARKASTVNDLARSLGADGTLPKGWTRSPDKIVEELNGYRLRAAGDGDATFPGSA
jgi:hypothetical protein